ncbi:hypothetical protein HPB50_007120 [Hyalomma asiaticum]|uniref:Uncharacterized protein n=1 Tax=Hyalomma asiaticum TaxID=266040 RepID=A0ACB7TD56_HYAAI|nr:hypothetical protein HPB50_007120 [Hyalomma asiaticum]
MALIRAFDVIVAQDKTQMRLRIVNFGIQTGMTSCNFTMQTRPVRTNSGREIIAVPGVEHLRRRVFAYL